MWLRTRLIQLQVFNFEIETSLSKWNPAKKGWEYFQSIYHFLFNFRDVKLACLNFFTFQLPAITLSTLFFNKHFFFAGGGILADNFYNIRRNTMTKHIEWEEPTIKRQSISVLRETDQVTKYVSYRPNKIWSPHLVRFKFCKNQKIFTYILYWCLWTY